MKGEEKYLGTTPLKRFEISGWVEFATSGLSTGDFEAFDFCIQKLDWVLMTRTYLASPQMTFADLAVYEALRNQKLFFMFRAKYKKKVLNVTRYYNNLDHNPKISSLMNTFRSAMKAKESTRNMISYLSLHKRFPAVLPGAVMGRVVTRFPPEASGFIHIGHAKAAWINYYFAKKYNGRMVFRFDDTNPEKEKVEYEQAILEDMKRLGIEVDHSQITHTSNYFDLFLEYAEKMIKEGKAYCDDSPREIFKQQKWDGVESTHRSNSVEKNLEMWEEMKQGSEAGQKTCLRAKMDMSDPNKCCRDPVMYRVKLGMPHPRHGTKYKVYPTYDFACPIVDSIEDVTHACRTSEYNDRNKQFYNFIDLLGLRNKPMIYDYSRLNFTHVVMSKRKLRRLVAEKVVDGWTDPRMPTVRALLRRGITLQAMEEFILSQGASRRVATFEWNKLYALNKKKIDPVVPRYSGFASLGMVEVEISGLDEKEIMVQLHPQSKQMGTRKIMVTSKVLLQKEDAMFVKDGEEVTLRHIGNIVFTQIARNERGEPVKMMAKVNPEGDVSKTEWKFTWLPSCCEKLTDLQLVYYDPLLTKPLLEEGDDFMQFVNVNSRRFCDAVGEEVMGGLKPGEIVQIERVGYFIVDVVQNVEGKIVMINIPENVRKKKVLEN